MPIFNVNIIKKEIVKTEVPRKFEIPEKVYLYIINEVDDKNDIVNSYQEILTITPEAYEKKIGRGRYIAACWQFDFNKNFETYVI